MTIKCIIIVAAAVAAVAFMFIMGKLANCKGKESEKK